MSSLVLEGRSAETGEPIRLTAEDGLPIVALEPMDAAPEGVWLSPGWLDMQINGFDGHDPNAAHADAQTTASMVRAMWRSGVSGGCVTICTESEEHIVRCLRAVDAACADPLVDAAVVGTHVEGPHLSREDGPRGAHALRYIRPPDVAEFHRWQEAAGGRIRIVTLSPEYDEAIPYIEALAAEGVIASIGHTAATSDQIRAAVDAGARWSTHLGNGAHALIRRHPNYVWDQLAEDRLSAGFIFDGQHLPPAVMKSVVRAKGVERSVLVSDAVYVAGLRPGVYQLPDGAEVELDEAGRLSLRGTPYLAGRGRCVAGVRRERRPPRRGHAPGRCAHGHGEPVTPPGSAGRGRAREPAGRCRRHGRVVPRGGRWRRRRADAHDRRRSRRPRRGRMIR